MSELFSVLLFYFLKSTPKTRFRECGSIYRVYSPVTTSSLDKEENMKKGAGVYSLNINRASSLNRGSLNPVLGVLLIYLFMEAVYQFVTSIFYKVIIKCVFVTGIFL